MQYMILWSCGQLYMPSGRVLVRLMKVALKNLALPLEQVALPLEPAALLLALVPLPPLPRAPARCVGACVAVHGGRP